MKAEYGMLLYRLHPVVYVIFNVYVMTVDTTSNLIKTVDVNKYLTYFI
jgi:hypothetical protein